ncbi:AIPR family protein [Phreatobacter sp.]|uniref:AIPR family protein n=1 Tax=Phreatobacter sp. TaxID=1966341 RepID=UPI0025E430CA|nr:AIPR family protein [Phreatobacter sp.]
MILLNSVLEKLAPSYPSGLSDDDLFEFYCADNILANYDLDHTEVQSGIVDGSQDGGIDAAYVFVNRILLTEDFKFDTIKGPVEIELIVIQAKNVANFKEAPVDKLTASVPLLLSHDVDPKDLEATFKPEVIKIFRSFLDAMHQLAGEFPTVGIRIYYCCKGDAVPVAVTTKADALAANLGTSFKNVEFSTLGAQQLYERSGAQKRLVKELPTVGSPMSGTNSYVTLCRLKNYVDFISDAKGELISRIFDANVRAYQGGVEVNKEIAKSVKEPSAGVDFWWLNNGVTIVADKATFMSNRLVIENPLIVNGLQTSYELYNNGKSIVDTDERMVLVRVIVENDQIKRDEIIRATNRQTGLKHSSFRATEPVHKEIEDYFLTQGYFYDRRRNHYKREGKPADKIIGIDRLAQAVLAVLLQEPHTARARPTTAIRDDADYKRIFSGDKAQHPLPLYGVATKLLSAVDEYFKSLAGTTAQIHRNNLRFHTLMVLGWALNGGTTLPALKMPHLDTSKATTDQLKAVTNWVIAEFESAGPADKTAKEAAFTNRLKANWKESVTKVS